MPETRRSANRFGSIPMFPPNHRQVVPVKRHFRQNSPQPTDILMVQRSITRRRRFSVRLKSARRLLWKLPLTPAPLPASSRAVGGQAASVGSEFEVSHYADGAELGSERNGYYGNRARGRADRNAHRPDGRNAPNGTRRTA